MMGRNSIAADRDPYWKYVTVLWHANNFTDACLGTLPISYFPNIPKAFNSPLIDNSVYRYPPGSVKLSASNNSAVYIENTTAYIFQGDWTLELFFRPSQLQSKTVYEIGGINGANWQQQQMIVYADGNCYIYLNSDPNNGQAGAGMINPPNALTYFTYFGAYLVNQWNHYAISKTGTNYSVYLNGTRGSYFSSALVPYSPVYQYYSVGMMLGNYPTSNPNGGGTPSMSSAFDGWIDEVRVTDGVGRYSGATIKVPPRPFCNWD